VASNNKSENFKRHDKSTQLISILRENPAGKMNLARIRFFGLFICALCKFQTVCFEKLFSIVMLAFARAYVVGVHVNNHVKPIRMLKHGKKAKSLFKYGLQIIATILPNPMTVIDLDIFKFLSCT
jgi:hypothetical protein